MQVTVVVEIGVINYNITNIVCVENQFNVPTQYACYIFVHFCLYGETSPDGPPEESGRFLGTNYKLSTEPSEYRTKFQRPSVPGN